MFDKDITVINQYYNKDSKKNEYKVSHVKGFWSSNDSISINGTQLVKTNGLSARILLSEKGYQEPGEFIKNKEGWTLQNDDYLVKGKIDNFNTIAELIKSNREVFKIGNVAIKDYGSKDMQHFVVNGV